MSLLATKPAPLAERTCETCDGGGYEQWPVRPQPLYANCYGLEMVDIGGVPHWKRPCRSCKGWGTMRLKSLPPRMYLSEPLYDGSQYLRETLVR